jgi:hypothetical protein
VRRTSLLRNSGKKKEEEEKEKFKPYRQKKTLF